jgi:hypothetical protein
MLYIIVRAFFINNNIRELIKTIIKVIILS